MNVIEHSFSGPIRRFRITLIADENGAFSTTRLPSVCGFWLALKVAPGEPSPSDNYSVYIVDQNGCDVAEGTGERLPGGQKAGRIIRYEGVEVHPTFQVEDVQILTVEGNGVAGAHLTVELIYGDGAELEELTLMGTT